MGKTVGTKIPVIQGLPRNVPSSDLKNMGAAAASTGAVALYHVVDVTPEAMSLGRAFGGERPVDRIQMDSDEFEMTKEEMSSVSEGEKVELVGLGCPHYSLEEVASAARMLEGKKIKEGVQLWICTHEAARTLAKELGYHDIIEASGARLITGCPLNLCIVPPYSEMSAMSDSGKFCYYRRSAFGSQEQCIKSAIAGRVMK